MKKSILILLAIILLIGLFNSCSHASFDSEGSASYYIYNGCTETITIVALTNQGNSSKTIEKTVSPSETVKLMDDSGIGINPAPEYSFSNIYAKDSSGTVIYLQNPVNNQAWIKKAHNSGNRDYYHTDYTLQIFR